MFDQCNTARPASTGRVLRRSTVAVAILIAGVTATALPAAADSRAARLRAECGESICLILQHESSLGAEAIALAEALGIRLARHDVKVVLGADEAAAEPAPPGAESAPPASEQGLLWIVHLRQLSQGLVLLAVDNLGAASDDDVVRELPRGETSSATAWTMALMIEEIVLPYLEDTGDQQTLGAGLAIIEPPVVGGTKKLEPVAREVYPAVRFLGLGLGVYRIGASDDFIAGPRLLLEGAFAKRLVASIGAGWAGWAEFTKGEVDGSSSLMPLDVMLGCLILPGNIVELSVHAGFSVGFSLYRTTRDDEHRVDALFDPWGQAALRAIFHIYGPWALYVDGGAAFVFVRDSLQNNGAEIYKQDWVLPYFTLGFQFWLEPPGTDG